MRVRLKSIAAALVLLAGSVLADPVTYELEAITGVKGGSLTGTIVWDSAVFAPTLALATLYSFTYTTVGTLGAPPTFTLDQSDPIFFDTLQFTGSVGDSMLIPLIPVGPQQIWLFGSTNAGLMTFVAAPFAEPVQWFAQDLTAALLTDNQGTHSPPTLGWKLNQVPAPIPEPGTFILSSLAVAGYVARRRKRRAFNCGSA